MALIIPKGSIGYVNPSVSIVDTGWQISGEYAIHASCNSGLIIAKTSLGLVVGRDYTFEFQVDNYVSGGVNIIAGTNPGTVRTANGTYTQTLTMQSTNILSFYSDGSLRIKQLSFYDTVLGTTAGTTITFNETTNQWGSDMSFHPEFFVKFIDQLFSLKNGSLWLHDSNPLTGNFYGVQYPAKVTFVVNVNKELDKIFFNFRVDGKGKWYAPSLTTPASNQFPHGMLSMLKKNNFSQIDGKLWASLLGDVNDPNFNAQPPLNALFNGRKLQGEYLVVEMVCDDTNEVNLSSVEVYYTEVFRGV